MIPYLVCASLAALAPFLVTLAHGAAILISTLAAPYPGAPDPYLTTDVRHASEWRQLAAELADPPASAPVRAPVATVRTYPLPGAAGLTWYGAAIRAVAADAGPIFRARRDSRGRYLSPIRSYSPAPAGFTPEVL